MRTIIPPRRGAERLIIRCHRRASQAPKHLPRISSLHAFPSVFFFFLFHDGDTCLSATHLQFLTPLPHLVPPGRLILTFLHYLVLTHIFIFFFFFCPRRNISDAQPSRQTTSANGSRSPALPSSSNTESLQHAGRDGSSQSRVV